MPYGLYISAEGAQAQNLRMQVIANNLANVDTAGFKRELAVIQARHSEAIEQGEASSGSGSINDIGGGVLARHSLSDFSQGTLKNTGISTDMAIEGEGFFEIEREGQRFLTRAGNFMLSNTGQLQTPDGYAVLSTGGGSIEIPVGTPWRVISDGTIVNSEHGNSLASIALVRPREPGDLSRVGQNLFSALGDIVPLAPQEASVHAGYLELSSVRPASEIMELIEASRAFEANVRLIQNQDHMIDSLISRVLGSA